MRISNLVFAFTLLAIGLNAFGSATENKEELEKKRFWPCHHIYNNKS